MSLCADMMQPWELKALIAQQADEITALRARVAELEEALRGVMYRGEYSRHCACPDCECARAALTKAGESND